MELRHLRYFQAVAQERGFGRAAAVLHLAQPALSRQIKDLEDEAGVELLERTPKGVALTAAGDSFLAGAARVMTAVEDALAASRRAAAGAEGRCTIGLGRMLLADPELFGTLTKLRSLMADAEIVIEEVNGFDQESLVASGDLDIGFVVTPLTSDTVSSEVWSIEAFTCAAVATDHPLATRELLEPDDLANEPAAFVAERRAPYLAELFRLAMTRAGIASQPEFVYSTPQSGLMMVASGRGWAPSLARLAGRLPNLTVVPVRGFEMPLRLDITWRTYETRPVVLAALDILRAIRDGKAPPTPRPSGGRYAPGIPVGLELRHFRYFAAVADDEGFGRAAEKLGVTQSSLSRQVADLEHHIGAPLFERTTRGVTLTDAGRALRLSCNRVMDEAEATLGAARQARRGLVGRCVIASVSTSQASRIIAATARICAERHPGVSLVFEEYLTPQQPDALREGLVDAGICHALMLLTDDPALSHQRLVEETVDSALVAESHPLAERERLTAPDLAEYPFLFMDRAFSPVMYDRVHAILNGLGLRPRATAGYDSLHLIWMLAAQGSGWALNFGVPRGRTPTGLVAIPVEGLSLQFGLDLLWRRDEVNPIVSKVLDVMREVRAAPQPPRRSGPSRRIRQTV